MSHVRFSCSGPSFHVLYVRFQRESCVVRRTGPRLCEGALCEDADRTMCWKSGSVSATTMSHPARVAVMGLSSLK